MTTTAGEKDGESILSLKRAYKIRSYKNGKSKEGNEYTNYSLTVPAEIAEALPDKIEFAPRMTEDGLLYEPIANNVRIELPAWAQNNGTEENSTSK